MKRALWLICALIIALGSWSVHVGAQSGEGFLKLDGVTSRYDLKGHLNVYEDKTAAEPIEQVMPKSFHPIDTSAPSFGFMQSAFWFKCSLENAASKPQTVVLEIYNQYIDFIDLFIMSDRDPALERYRGGARTPIAERFSNTRQPALRLRFAPGEQKTVFVRIQSKTPLRLPFALVTEQTYLRNELIQYLLLGLFFGALVFLIVYSLFAWSILRQRAYLYYILTIAGVGLNQLALNGFVPAATLFSQPERMLHLLTAGIGVTCVFNILFVSSFMDARAKYPVLYRLLDVFFILGVAVVIFYLADFYVGNRIAMVYGPVLGCVLAAVIGLMWYWGEAHARYLFLAHVPLPIIASIHVGVMSGLIPYHPMLAHLLPVAYLSQGMFFALALADRYAIMQGRFRHMLETQVAERSVELVQANERLQNEIIQRKRTERAIETAKSEWEQTFDAVPDLIAILDRNHIIQRVNRAMADKMNLDPQDAIGRPCYELCHASDAPIHNCPLQNAVDNDEEWSAEVVEPRLGGAFIVSVTPLPTENHQPDRFVHVARDITDRKIFEERLHTLASTDGLTGIWNRRHFLHLAERELARTRRYGGECALIMIDIDHFKKVNDSYGHDVGDQTLKEVADIVRANLRQVDVFARFGGEEFVIALPETGVEQALLVGERLRRQIAEAALTDQSPPLHITISIGVAVAAAESADLTTVLKQADDALYAAKRNGRNRVEAYSEIAADAENHA